MSKQKNLRNRPVVVRSTGQQRGMVLLVALVILLAMTLAGALMLRSVGAGVAVAGNLGFKQTSIASSDYAIEDARAWLSDPLHIASDFENDNNQTGYKATWEPNFDPLTYPWHVIPASGVGTRMSDTTANVVIMPTDLNTGNTVQYIIHRLCSATGPFTNSAAQKCVTPLSNVTLAGTPCIGLCNGIDPKTKRPYYRITAQVTGPRNTTTYVQVVMF